VWTNESGDTICEVAGLAKTEAPGLQAEVQKLAAYLK
jgi:hypothetical protein